MAKTTFRSGHTDRLDFSIIQPFLQSSHVSNWPDNLKPPNRSAPFSIGFTALFWRKHGWIEKQIIAERSNFTTETISDEFKHFSCEKIKPTWICSLTGLWRCWLGMVVVCRPEKPGKVRSAKNLRHFWYMKKRNQRVFHCKNRTDFKI